MNIEEIIREHRPFVNNLQIGDKVIVELGEELYREGIVQSDIYIAPSGNRYINIKVNEKVYAVPTWDVYPLGSKKVVITAYIYSGSYRGKDFSGRGTYFLSLEGKKLKKAECCTGRKDANKKLLDEELFKKYGINKVVSNYLTIYEV